ncbi:MAG: nitroreductase family protein [Clostridiales bacterium]|nr:nitroreductase family protein [Clostridiales bacterium]
MKEIFSRRSIRKYQDKPIEDELIQKLLRAAMYAPSAGNEKPWQFIVIKDRDKLNEITTFHPYTQMLKEAPLAILVCADVSNLKYNGVFWVQDIAACTQNILLEGKHLGLGTCWCGVYPSEDKETKLREMFNIPENFIPTSLIAVGYPAEEREVRERYNPDRVHYEKW